MGKIYSLCYVETNIPNHVPKWKSAPTYPSDYGFQAPRKERVSQLTEQELKASRLPNEYRDYCAHHYLNVLMCAEKNKPFYGRCTPELHASHECQREDYILRMKEYEREKRLRLRDLKKQRKDVP